MCAGSEVADRTASSTSRAALDGVAAELAGKVP